MNNTKLKKYYINVVCTIQQSKQDVGKVTEINNIFNILCVLME